ncbi:MAG TPA: hypothetical protein DEV93_14040 [Chloroflexi bacterium]|jgi:hypothetical protein|nr:hypothetical protein [Chloroflexota bacterium]
MKPSGADAKLSDQPRVEPHDGGILDTKAPYYAKRPVPGVVVAVLDARAKARRLELTVHPSRAILKGEVHELLATDEAEARRNAIVNRVSYLACVEITKSGMVLIHDRVVVKGRTLGHVIGFDETHAPNHANIVIRIAGEFRTGRELGLELEDEVSFEMEAGPVNIFD